MSEYISLHLAKKINYACYQNDIAILKELSISNSSDCLLENVTLTINSDLNFIKEKIVRIDNIAAKDSIQIKDRNIELNSEKLRNLTESVTDSVKLCLRSDDNLIEEVKIPIQVLAYNEWGGLEYIPELLAAFVMPNSFGIDSILGETGRLLDKNGKSSVLNGYKSGSVRGIWDMISALYTVLLNKNFTYCLPPTSFEMNGQKIRLAQDILQNRVATCLDATLLFGSLFEQMGLNPVIVILKEHAFVGVWLKDTTSDDMIIDDAQYLRKRIDLNELLVFEAVGITNNIKFSEAITLAKQKLSNENEGDFAYMIDIKKARGHKIKPLSLNHELKSETKKSEIISHVLLLRKSE